MSPPRQRRGNSEANGERRRQLLDAAERVFHRRGYAGATIQEIADEFGILKGSTYHYVNSKEELLLEVQERAYRHVFADIVAAVDSADTPIDRLWMFLYSLIYLNAETPTMGSLAKASLGLPPGEGRNRIIDERRRFEDLFRELLRDAQVSGAVSGDIDSKVVAYGIFGLSNSIYVWYQPAGPVPPAELARRYTDLLITGLVATAAETRAPWQQLGVVKSLP